MDRFYSNFIARSNMRVYYQALERALRIVESSLSDFSIKHGDGNLLGHLGPFLFFTVHPLRLLLLS